MKISVVCSNEEHPVWPRLVDWCAEVEASGHEVSLVNSVNTDMCGDILFLVSCSDIISADLRIKFKNTLVLHASDLPEGRGWSPYIWDILQGKNKLILSLIEAADPVDTGCIYLKKTIPLDGNELLDRIHDKLFQAECELMTEAVNLFPNLIGQEQDQSGISYHRKRTPQDNELDIDKSLRAQFQLLRVCDNARFPAFFRHLGKTYRLTIEDVTDE